MHCGVLTRSEINSILDRDRLEESLATSCTTDELDAVLAGTPSALRILAHYAVLWGITDDIARLKFVQSVHPDLLQNLLWVVDTHDDLLDFWLAGPEADVPPFSDAYIAFSCFRMASDELR